MATRTSREPAEKLRSPSARHAPRWGRWLLVLLVLGAGLWFLPNIVARTPAVNWALALAARDLDGSVRAGSASLAWLSPPMLGQVEIRDAQGQVLAVLPSVQGEKSLLALLSDTRRPGRFRIQQPRLEVLVDDRSSNVERVLAKYLQPQGELPERDLALEITEAQVTVRDAVRQDMWEIQPLQVSLQTPYAGRPLELKGSANVESKSGRGRVSIEARLPSPAAAANTAGQLALHVEALPLGLVRAAISRFLPLSGISGVAAGDVSCDWGSAGLQVRAKTSVAGLVVAAPLLGSDVLRLDRLTAEGQAVWLDQQLQIQRAAAETDVGQVQLSGTLPAGAGSWPALLAALRRQACECSGRLDLARLAALLPGTLRIQQQAQIDSGQVTWSLAGRPQNDETLWQARLEMSELKARCQGREFTWPQPVLVTLAARDGRQGLALDQLKCESNFLSLEAAGTAESLKLAGKVDLNQLTRQLEQLVDLGGLRAAGEAWADVTWKRPSPQRFEAEVDCQARDLRLAIPGYSPWEEENVVGLASAAGQTDAQGGVALETASLRLTTAGDVLEVRLGEPVQTLTPQSQYPLAVQMQGRLEAWPRRLRNWLALDDWRLAGGFRLAGRMTVGPDAALVDDLRCDVEQASISGPWLEVQEPAVQIALAGRWDRVPGRLTLKQGTLQASALALQLDEFLLEPAGDGQAKLSGTLKGRADLAGFQALLAQRGLLAGPMAGTVEATLVLRQAADVTALEATAVIENLSLRGSDGKPFAEPQVELHAQGQYQHTPDVLQLERFAIESQSLSGSGSGRIAALRTQPQADLTAELQYDFDRLDELLRPYVGGALTLAGKGRAPIGWKGPLSPAAAEAQTTLAWTSGQVYGFQLGPATINAKLAGGVLVVEPFSVAVNDGQVSLAPSVRVDSVPPELSLPPGPIAQQVHIDPAMCEGALKYAAPVLAGVTAAEGKFSVELERCRMPLGRPELGEMAGKLTVHSMEVAPGPMIQELALLLGYVSPGRLKQESVIPFELRGGRVYHSGMELIFPELTVRTSGSVGLDQTLDLVAEIVLPEKWDGNSVLGGALRGQTIRVPLNGTLSRPALNRRELENVTRQVIGNAARNLLQDNVKKQLERLLPLKP